MSPFIYSKSIKTGSGAVLSYDNLRDTGDIKRLCHAKHLQADMMLHVQLRPERFGDFFKVT